MARLLNNPIYLRYGFFLFLSLGILLNTFLFLESEIYVLFIVSIILFGAGFYDKNGLFLFFFTMVVVSLRVFIIDDEKVDTSIFITHLFSYLLIMFISASMMKHYQKNKKNQMELIFTLVKSLDARDTYTMHHSENVAKYSLAIAKEMNLTKNEQDHIYTGGLLHDIGKIGIPEYILTKPGKLTLDEYAVIKEHTTIGYETLKHISDFQQNNILDIVLYHHERYDGKGYPKGLKGENIPLAARIMCVADSFDAMTSKRVYRDELDLEYTLNQIKENRGSQFDPEITDIFLNMFEKEETKKIIEDIMNKNIVQKNA